MASSYMVLNPRRRRRRKRAVARRRRRNPYMYALNRRRRARGRRRRNPRALFGGGRKFELFGMDVGAAALVTTGMLGTSMVSGFAAPMIPAQFQQPPFRLLIKGVIAAMLPMLAQPLFGRAGATWVGIGGAVSVVQDVYKMLQEQVPGLPALGDYNETVGDYVPGVALGEGAGGPSYEFGAIPAPAGNWAPNWAPNWSNR